jgi:hypothetical protein
MTQRRNSEKQINKIHSFFLSSSLLSRLLVLLVSHTFLICFILFVSAARFGCSLSFVSDNLFLFGGFSRGGSNLADLWRFQSSSRVWTEIQSAASPTPRGYSSLVFASSLSSLVLFGGCQCTPGCKCSNEVWSFHTTIKQWFPIQVSKEPGRYSDEPLYPRYKSSGFWDSSNSRLLVFGGESFHPHHYFNQLALIKLRQNPDWKFENLAEKEL